MPTPLLIYSDAPCASSGLARITRDLATRISANLADAFTVGTVGYGGPGSARLPFTQYAWSHRPDFVIPELPEIWDDFTKGERGILLSIQDLSRLMWLSDPNYCPEPRLKSWLLRIKQDKMATWVYPPHDATGPHNRLTAQLAHIIKGFDRVVAYSQWSAGIISDTLGNEWGDKVGLTCLPHGIDTSVFQPRPRLQARHSFGHRIGAPKSIPDDALAIGIVATNQARKDYGLAIQAVAEVSKTRKAYLWIHTDALERHWSIPALLNDYGLLHCAVVTIQDFSDETMSWLYSAMDVTLAPGGAEGYGYPIFESLACGVPCIHGNYGGAPEHMPTAMLIQPEMMRLEGVWNCQRPVHNPKVWADRIRHLAGNRSNFPGHLDWENLWPNWKSWLLKGLA